MSTELEKKIRYDRLFTGYSQKTLRDFKQYHQEHPQIYQGFKELAFRMKRTGRSHYSSKMIINVLRWETDIRAEGECFKICDRYQSIYGRLLAYHYPEFEEFFSFRAVGTERQYTEGYIELN